MTDEEMRIAIAEACGWTQQTCANDTRIEWWFPPGCNRDYVRAQEYPPDYPNDLNACHEMEKVILTGNDWRVRLERYSNQLMTTMHATDFGRIDVAFKRDAVGRRYFTVHATARQRCEAFLRTIGQWEE